jgi:hypothetical protein
MTSDEGMDHTPKFKAGDLVRWKGDKAPIGRIKEVLQSTVYEFDCDDKDYPSREIYQDVTFFDERAEIYAPPDRGEIHEIIGYDE